MVDDRRRYASRKLRFECHARKPSQSDAKGVPVDAGRVRREVLQDEGNFLVRVVGDPGGRLTVAGSMRAPSSANR